MSKSRSPSPFDVLANLVLKTAPIDPPAPERDPEVSQRLAKGAAPAVPDHARTRPNTPAANGPVSKPFRKKNKRRNTQSVAAVQPVRVKPGRLTPKMESARKRPKPARLEGPAGLTGPEALRYVLQAVDGASLATIAPVLDSLDEATTRAIQARIERGAGILRSRPDPDPMGYRVGLDFGTSATKVVLCSDAADADYALEVPFGLRVNEDGRRQQHLWQTCVWYEDAAACFRLAPSAAARPITGFKTGLIQADGHRMLFAGISHKAAAAAYLALLIAYIVGADAERIERMGGAPRHYSRFHVGVPVPSLEEDPRVAGFHQVVQAAFALAPTAAELRLDDVRDVLSRDAGPLETSADTPYQLFEELAGVVAGYMLTPERAAGPHILVDVGAATLDVATLHIPDGEHPLEVYESGVQILGAQALQATLAAGVPEPTFRSACQEHTKSVLSKTYRTKHFTFLPGEGGSTKPMIYVGGGRMTALHQGTYEGYSKAFLAPMRSPGVGRWLERELDTDQERLLLAWGLAQDPASGIIPHIRPPSTVVPVLRGRKDWEGGFIGSEHC